MPSETLVLIPPILCDARVCADQIRDLSRDHAVMFAPTHQGERMEEIASQILTWAPPKFALAGIGMGGMVAMEMLRRAEDRITRIALISSNPQADTPEAAAAREPHIIAAQAGRMDDVLQHEINATWLAPGADKMGVMRLLREMGTAMGPAAYVRQVRALQRRRDQQAVLRKMKQSAMILCGRFDGQHPVKRQAFLAELIPYCTLEVIEDAGYMPTLEAPDAVSDALRRWMTLPLVQRH